MFILGSNTYSEYSRTCLSGSPRDRQFFPPLIQVSELKSFPLGEVAVFLFPLIEVNVNTGLEEEESVCKGYYAFLQIPTYRGPLKAPNLGKRQPFPLTEAPDQVSRKSHSHL
jgi:hypothetical protein